MKKRIILCTAFLVMNLCACGTSATVKQVTTTVEPSITTTPTKEEKDIIKMEDERLSVKKSGDAFYYDGKEVAIGTDESEGAYIMEVKYVNNTQIAVFCHYTLDAQILLVYDTEKEAYIAKKTGLNFTWKDKDISTLVYVAGPELTDKDYVVYNYDDETLYHSEHAVGILSLTKDGKVKIEENVNDKEEAEADWVEKEISLK